jgi:hypothetical protein
MDFKYTSLFEIKANLRKNDFAKGSFVSKASLGLEDLKTLLPHEDEIKSNPDLLYTCFNAAVANLINLNGDGITTEGAKQLVESCKLKPMNIEHSRGDIIGVITNYGFSSFGNNKILTPDELTNDPFNISLAAIVWKLSNRAFAEFIESSQDEDGFFYKEVSTSWEVGFNSFKLAIGSKDLRKARIVESEDELESLSKYLISMGGTGFTPEGEEVYRVIGDDCRFLGCAFTTNPAAAVQGVLSVDYKSLASEVKVTIEEEDEEEEDEEEDEDTEENLNKKPSKEEEEEDDEEEKDEDDEANCKNKEISLNKKNRVIKYMKYNTVDELVDHLHEAAASDVREFISSQIKQASDEFALAKQAKEDKERELAEAMSNISTLKSESDSLKTELDELKAALKQQEDQTKFSERMESLKEEFDVDQAAAKTIAKRILGLSDEAFAEWLEDFKPFLKVKSQAATTEAKASVNPPLPNSQGDTQEKKSSKWAETLSKISVKVSK